jgi:hypothetical protein
MSEDEKSREPLTLRRWSARKHAAAQELPESAAATVLSKAQPLDAAASPTQPQAAKQDADAVSELPPVESLTFDS